MQKNWNKVYKSYYFPSLCPLGVPYAMKISLEDSLAFTTIYSNLAFTYEATNAACL